MHEKQSEEKTNISQYYFIAIKEIENNPAMNKVYFSLFKTEKKKLEF